jgi:hypothetical protein
MNAKLLQLLSVTSLALLGCASSNTFKNSEGPNAGTIEFINVSPQYRVNITVFKEADDCRGIKTVSAFEALNKKSVKEDHKDKLSMMLGVLVQGNPQAVSGCSGAYTLPFNSGDLRVTLGFKADDDQCHFTFESGDANSKWRVTPHVEVKKIVQPFFQDGAWCTR